MTSNIREEDCERIAFYDLWFIYLSPRMINLQDMTLKVKSFEENLYISNIAVKP